jgi:protein glucosyltransferase
MKKQLSFVSVEDHFRYKYLIDADGYAGAHTRFRWGLLSNSTLLKVMSPLRAWYYKAATPWVHYVPIKGDASDLPDIVTFLKEHDALAYQIALDGQKLGQQIFSLETVDLYMVTLLNEYAKRVRKR